MSERSELEKHGPELLTVGDGAPVSERSELGHRFRRLLVSTTVTNLGDGIGRTALPLLAASLTRDPAAVAGLTAAVFLPWLLFALPSGALVDRVDRRVALVRANAGRAAVMVGLAAVVATGSTRIWLLYLTAFLIGAAETIADNAAQTLLPSLVSSSDLERANSRVQGAMLVTDAFIGAPLAGVLFAVGHSLPFAVDAAGFLLGALVLTRLPGSYRATPPPGKAAITRTRLRSEVAEGMRWLRGNAFVFRLTGIAGMLGLLNSAANGVLVLFALEKLHLDERTFGVFLTSAAVGGLAGSATATRISARLGRIGALAATLGVCGVCYIGVGLSSNAFVAAAFFAVLAWCVLVWNIVSMSVRQAVIPDHLLGRVLGAWRMVVWGCMPIGATLGGFAARAWGLRAPFIAAGILNAVLVLPTLRLGRYDEPAPSPGPEAEVAGAIA